MSLLKDYSDKLVFIPLGGSNEIGMNLNLYCYKGKILIVDCGAGFADEAYPGVDMIVADVSFITENKKNVVGMVLTHAHEDHIGGIQYVWNQIGCAIYTTPFTSNFLKRRLKEFDFAKKIPIFEVQVGSKIDLSPFNIEMVPLTHSAPEMQALMIRTGHGNILHTGDWKFDPDPIIGNPSDEEVLRKYGDEGILALVCDSTNVFSPGTSGSEGELRKSLIDIVSGCKKMVVITTFASNLARLDTLFFIAQKTNRKIVLSGRSLHRVFEAARDSGYFKDVDHIIDDNEVSRFPKEKILVIATGCQGEPLASTNKLAQESHPKIKLSKGDTVIFSSKIIPGNEKKIFKLFNVFAQKGIEVITERDHFVHVSGHPSINELKKMYELTRPHMCIPVHGETIHLHEHCKIAKASGIKHAIEVYNGALVTLDYDSPKISGRVYTDYLAVDGNYLLASDSRVLKMRRKLSESGIFIMTIIINSQKNISLLPKIVSYGCLDDGEDFEFLQFIKNETNLLINDLKKSQKFSEEAVKKSIISLVRRLIKKEIGKNPMIEIQIVRT